MPPRLDDVAEAAAKGTENAAKLGDQQSKAKPPGFFDVWKHTGDGVQDRYNELAENPAKAAAYAAVPGAPVVENLGNATLGAVEAAQAYGVEAASWGDMTNSMSAQWNSMSDQIDKFNKAEGFLGTLGAGFGVLTALEQLISTPFAMIPFPAVPALRILDMDVGLPHPHAHPPNLIPPAPPVPLPSTGPIIPIPILSGAATVLINGMPAGRCGDTGLSIWCGSYFPFYDVFLGSASVWLEGSRAGRLLCDVTKHCVITLPPKPTPTDPPITTTFWGTTIMASGNVMIGGAPMPSLVSGAIGAVFKLVFKGLGKIAKWAHKQASKSEKYSRIVKKASEKAQKAKNWLGQKVPFYRKMHCPTDPTDPFTGDYYHTFTDYEVPLGFLLKWERYYNSVRSGVTGPMGYGFRHTFQRVLRRTSTGFVYETPDGDSCEFASIEPGETTTTNDGLLLREVSETVYRIEEFGEPAAEFHMSTEGVGRLRALLQGSRVNVLYNARGMLVGVQNTGGQSLNFVYDDRSRITHVNLQATDAALRTIARYEYNQSGHLVAWQDANGHRGTYGYDSNGRMNRRTDRNGFSFHYRYDGQGRCIHAYGDDGIHDCRIEYNTTDHITVFNYAGARWEHHFSPTGQLLAIIDPLGGRQTFEVDESGRTVAEIDPLGNVTQVLYDENGRNTGRIDPNGQWLPSILDDPRPADPYEEVLPNSALGWELGGLLSLSEIRTTERAAKQHAQLVAQMPPDVVLAPFDPQAVDESFVATLPLPLAQQIRDSAAQNSGDRSGIKARAEVDAMGRILEYTGSDGRVVATRYDANGNVTALRDPDGCTEQIRYGGFDRATHVIDGEGNTTEFKYSATEETTHVIDASGAINQYVYDQKLRLIEVRRHGRVRERYEYDLADNLLRKTDGKGIELLALEHAPGNLMMRRQLASGEAEEFKYDEHGRIVLAKNGTWTVEQSHTDNGMLVSDLRNHEGVEHKYHAGQLVESVLLTEFSTQYQVEDDTPSKRVVTDPTGRSHRFHVSYDGMISRTLANGTVELSNYDASGRCVRKTTMSANSEGALHDQEYTYSPGGRLLQISDSDRGATQYEYDKAGRLSAELMPGNVRRMYQYDSTNNLLSVGDELSTTIADGNRIHRANDDQFEFNERDHVSKRTGPDSEWRYEYDSRDMLTTAQNGTAWSASYDPLGRRMQKRYGDETVEFFWDGPRLAAERFHDHRLRQYVYPDPLSLVPFMFIEYKDQSADPATGTPYYIFTNHLGVPIRVEDDDGRTVWRAQVDPYGTVHIQSGSRIEMPLRFPGHYHDAETGLHYNRWRYYCPDLGRYLQSDPMGLGGGYNVYAYPTSPLTEVDLLGLNGCPMTPPKNRAPSAGKKTGVDVETPGGAKPRKKMTPEEVKKTGMKGDDVDALEEMAKPRALAKHPDGKVHPDGTPVKHEGRVYIVRGSNADSLPYQGKPGYKPKPLEVKLKTADAKAGHKNPGLVTNQQDWTDLGNRKNWEELKGKGYYFDKDGILCDPKGTKVHGDYDLQGAYDKWDDGTMTPIPGSKKTNDPVFLDQANDELNGGNPKMFQHGGNDDYRPPDKGGKPGRDPGNDEVYTWVDPDGSKVIDDTKKLQDEYGNNGLDWPYPNYPKEPSPPGPKTSEPRWVETENGIEPVWDD